MIFHSINEQLYDTHTQLICDREKEGRALSFFLFFSIFLFSIKPQRIFIQSLNKYFKWKWWRCLFLWKYLDDDDYYYYYIAAWGLVGIKKSNEWPIIWRFFTTYDSRHNLSSLRESSIKSDTRVYFASISQERNLFLISHEI